MLSFADRLAAANTLLAPYAVPHQGTLGRPVDEPPDDTRFPFQRDRGRIIHAQAFRRLQGKTQVFVAGEGDHFRTRLTHTMEVAQIGRDIARTLRLNEDLTECIALAHDLGHPPFGHRGEQALDAWMREQGSSFEHNQQSLRIVTLLEDHSSQAPGLNVSREIVEGLQKHGGSAHFSLEAQTVNIADEIAYCAHDCEDGIRAGLFTLEDLAHIPLGKIAIDRAAARHTFVRGALIHLLVTDLYAESEKRISLSAPGSIDDVYRSPAPLIDFSAAMRSGLNALRAFLATHMYAHSRVEEAGKEGQHIVRSLCETYLRAPGEKILALQKKTGGTLAEAVKDYVAGMTDGFARGQAAYNG